MKLEWADCPESDNIYAESLKLGRYWICYRGNSFRLEHVDIDRAGGKWTDIGNYKTIPAAKRGALAREKNNNLTNEG